MSKRGKGTIIYSMLHEPRSGGVTVFEACGTSKLCILGIQHMFGPDAKQWWLSSRTHLSGYHLWVRLVHHYFLPDNERGQFYLGGDYFFACNKVYIYRSCSRMTCMIQFEHTHMHVYA